MKRTVSRVFALCSLAVCGFGAPAHAAAIVTNVSVTFRGLTFLEANPADRNDISYDDGSAAVRSGGRYSFNDSVSSGSASSFDQPYSYVSAQNSLQYDVSDLGHANAVLVQSETLVERGYGAPAKAPLGVAAVVSVLEVDFLSDTPFQLDGFYVRQGDASTTYGQVLGLVPAIGRPVLDLSKAPNTASATAFSSGPLPAGSYRFLLSGVGYQTVNSNDNVLANYGITGATFSVTALVPEPASWTTMIAGFGVAGAVLRRRKIAPSLA